MGNLKLPQEWFNQAGYDMKTAEGIFKKTKEVLKWLKEKSKKL